MRPAAPLEISGSNRIAAGIFGRLAAALGTPFTRNAGGSDLIGVEGIAARD
jgi:hypothetical protein